jgi:hypothetical protein
MRVPRDRHSRFYFSFHNYRHIARYWAVRLRQNFRVTPGWLFRSARPVPTHLSQSTR